MLQVKLHRVICFPLLRAEGTIVSVEQCNLVGIKTFLNTSEGIHKNSSY